MNFNFAQGEKFRFVWREVNGHITTHDDVSADEVPGFSRSQGRRLEPTLLVGCGIKLLIVENVSNANGEV